MSFSGTFDPSKHPRLASGQHGGGEFEAGSGGTAGAQPVSAPGPPAAVAPAAPHAPGVATAPGVKQPPGAKAAGAPVGDDQQQEGQTIGHRLLRVAVASADDVVVLALNSIAKRHPEWFEALRGLVGLAKMAPDQPRDADGRWAVVADSAAVALAGAGGGAAGAAGGALGVRIARRQALDAARTAAAPIRTARRDAVAPWLAARSARRQAVADNIERGLRNPKKTFLSTAIRGLSSQARKAEATIRRGESALAASDFNAALPDSDFSALFPDVDFTHAAPASGADPFALGDAIKAQRNLHAKLDDLKTNGKLATRKSVSGSARRAHVEEFEKPREVRKVRWDTAKVAARIEAKPEHFARLGIRSVADAEQMAFRTPARAMMDMGLPAPQVYRDIVRSPVRNNPGAMPAHSRYSDGYPNQAGRKKLADLIRSDVADRLEAAAAHDRQSVKATWPITAARTEARNNGWLRAMQRSMILRQHGKAAIVGAGVLGAVAAGSAALGLLRGRRVEKLAKVADKPTPDPAQQVFDAGAEVEQPLAEKIADTFGRWSRLPSALLTNPTAGLHALLSSSMDKAMAPLNDAAQGGAAAEVPVVQQDGTGRNRIVGMSLDTGSDKVRIFSNNYRVKLAGQMADEQFKTLQTVLRDATLNGQPPAVTARLLRQVIGLTPVQAGYVLSYRKALLTLDPNALRRALRDARYDKTVARAITTKTALSDDQVNAMVDAYQRRSLALRAMTIARTEGVGAANNGHALAVQEFTDDNPGFTVIKTWMSTDDERTRPDHVAMNGQQVIGLYTSFVAPSGDRIMWPHDPNAPARQLVNCRCAFSVALVPRTAAAHRGFSLLADSPLEDADEALV